MSAYAWRSRAIALVAVLALIGAIVSDARGGQYWERHGLVAGILGNFLVVILSVAVLNVAIARRRNGRWRVLAQYVMLQLVVNARLIWTGVAELALNLPSGARTASTLNAGSRAVRDTSSLTDAVRQLLADTDRRARLRDALSNHVASSDAMFGRWAAVMLNANIYAELIDRHVELASYVSWLDSLLNSGESDDQDGSQQTTSHSHPALQIEGDVGDDSLASRLVVITQLAEELDRRTLCVAQRIVSIEWWEHRLGITPPL